MSGIKRAYILGKGGLVGRSENGAFVVFKPGDTIWCDDDEALGASVRGRLTSKAETDLVKAGGAIEVEVRTDEVVTAKPAIAVAPKTPDATVGSAHTAIPTQLVKNWSFVLDMNAPDLVALVKSLDDPSDLDALRDMEMSEAGKKRALVRNAVATRKRQLNAVKMQARRKANAAERREAKMLESVKGAEPAE